MIALVVKATVILAVALVAARMARRGRASLRHLLLAASFAALLLLPVAAVWLPALTVRVPVEQASLTSSLPAAVTDGARVAPGMTVPAQTASEPAQTGGARGRWTPLVASNPLLALWMAGVLIFVVPVLAGLWQMRRLRRDGLPWLRAGALADEIARKAGVARRVEILCHEALAGPMTCGILRPVILLPRDARAWRDDDLRRALTHELAHIRRADWLVLTLARTVCACYWFHPLVWMAWRKLRLEAERASDDVVLRGADATRYAEQLVTLAERMTLQPARAQTLLGMASRNDLATRVRAVLDTRQRRGTAGRHSMVVTAIAVAAIVALIGPIHLVAVAQSQLQSATARPTFEVASVRAAVAQDGAPKEFEVASVRRATPDTPFSVRVLPGRVSARATPLRSLILRAFDIPGWKLIDAPGWVGTERFDIDATIAQPASAEDVNAMLRTLLERRFRLSVQAVTREMAVDVLLVARPKPGPGMHPVVVDCETGLLRDGSAPGVFPADARIPCGTFRNTVNFGGGQVSARRRVAYSAFTMDDLANALAGPRGRPVINRTALSGQFDIELDYVSDTAMPPPAQTAQGPGLVAPGGPSLATALREQLHLELRGERQTVELLSVRSVERPEEN